MTVKAVELAKFSAIKFLMVPAVFSRGRTVVKHWRKSLIVGPGGLHAPHLVAFTSVDGHC